jgi:hypothetical protein
MLTHPLLDKLHLALPRHARGLARTARTVRYAGFKL